jgi:hypothetical protein
MYLKLMRIVSGPKRIGKKNVQWSYTLFSVPVQSRDRLREEKRR